MRRRNRPDHPKHRRITPPMAYLELSEKDRKRYGVPERVEFEPGQLGMRTISQLRKQTGYEFDALLDRIEGVPRRDPETGDLALEDDKDDDDNPVLNDDGTPKRAGNALLAGGT